MIKKQFATGIFIAALGCCSLNAESTATAPKSNEIFIQDEVDDTDIYAIPLDNDEEEEAMEEDYLESLEKPRKQK